MSALPEHDDYLTEGDYFALLADADGVKYELIDGEIVAMSGAKPRHQAITSDLNGIFYNATRGTRCRHFDADTPVRIPTGSYVYPDLTVVCGEPEYVEDAPIGILTNPALIVEVLSDTTEHKDRTTKFDRYGEIPTLQDYVLVAQDAPRIECYSRGERGAWILTKAVGLDASLRLPALDVTLALAEVYQRVSFDDDAAADN